MMFGVNLDQELWIWNCWTEVRVRGGRRRRRKGGREREKTEEEASMGNPPT